MFQNVAQKIMLGREELSPNPVLFLAASPPVRLGQVWNQVGRIGKGEGPPQSVVGTPTTATPTWLKGNCRWEFGNAPNCHRTG